MSERKRIKVYSVTLEIPEDSFIQFRKWTLDPTTVMYYGMNYQIIQITRTEKFED